MIIGLILGALAGMALNPLSAAFEPFSQDVANRAWAFHPVKNIDPLTLVELRMRGEISAKEYTEKMKEHGYDEQKSELYFQAAKKLLDARELVIAKWRGYLAPTDFYKEMEKLGYDTDKANMIEAVAKFYPSVEDFIRFAVRDVFNDERVKKYELDKEYPQQIEQYAKKAGVDPDILKWYWRAHWELPGVTEVLRMVNMLQPAVLDTKLPDGTTYGDKYRDFGLDPSKIKTDYSDLDEYLAMADISPFWRDRIKALTFPPLTRVDLRRIYELGLISDDELRARLLELGYSLKDAERLMQFYKMMKHKEGRDLTRSMIVKGYLDKLLTKDMAIEYLQNLGYDKDEAEFIIQLAETEQAHKEIKDQIKLYEELYIRGAITEDEFKQKLQDLNISLTKMEYELEKAKMKKQKAVKLPSKEDMIKWLKLGIIDEDTFRNLMSQRGYSDQFIDYYVKEVQAETGGSK